MRCNDKWKKYRGIGVILHTLIFLHMKVNIESSMERGTQHIDFYSQSLPSGERQREILGIKEG